MNPSPMRTLALAAALALPCASVTAGPGYYLVTAYDNYGVSTIDTRYWTVKFPNRSEIVWPEVGFGYGVTTRWYTELYATYIGTTQSALKLETWNWQNDFLLTQGEFPFDLALHANFTRYAELDEGHAIEFGPVLQTDVGRTQLNLNVFVARDYAAAGPEPTELKYQWQIRYRWVPLFNVGLQGFGELGQWNHWAPHDQQSHRAGPAFFGTLPTGDRQSLQYQAAYLFGTIYGQPGRMFSMRVQYAF